MPDTALRSLLEAIIGTDRAVTGRAPGVPGFESHAGDPLHGRAADMRGRALQRGAADRLQAPAPAQGSFGGGPLGMLGATLGLATQATAGGQLAPGMPIEDVSSPTGWSYLYYNEQGQPFAEPIPETDPFFTGEPVMGQGPGMGGAPMELGGQLAGTGTGSPMDMAIQEAASRDRDTIPQATTGGLMPPRDALAPDLSADIMGAQVGDIMGDTRPAMNIPPEESLPPPDAAPVGSAEIDVGSVPAQEDGPDGAAREKYRVRRGDTLSGIALEHGTTVDELVRANNIANPDLIFVDQVLRIPESPGAQDNTQVHEIQRGQTLSEIAEQYGTTTDHLVRLNNIEDPDVIFAGATIRVPDTRSAGN